MAVLDVIHLLAAAVWVGGVLALVFVAVPAAQRLTGAERAATLRAIGERWRPLGWGAIVVASVTGLGIAGWRGVYDGDVSTGFAAVLAAKALLIGLMVALSILHDFLLGPRLARQIREGAPQTLRRPMVLIGRTTLGLTLAVPILGGVLDHLAR